MAKAVGLPQTATASLLRCARRSPTLLPEPLDPFWAAVCQVSACREIDRQVVELQGAVRIWPYRLPATLAHATHAVVTEVKFAMARGCVRPHHRQRIAPVNDAVLW